MLLAVFGGLCCYSYFIGSRVRLSLGVGLFWVSWSAVYSGLAVQYQLATLAVAVFISFSAFLVEKPRHTEIKFFLSCLTIGGILNALMAYLQVFGLDNTVLSYFGVTVVYVPGLLKIPPTGFLGQQTLYGIFAASAMISGLFLERWWGYFAALLILPTVVLSESSFVYLSSVCGALCFVYFYFPRRVFAALLVGLSLFSAYFLMKNPNSYYLDSQGRFEIWRNIANETMKKPMNGFGFGTYTAFINRFQPENSMRDNGVFLQAHSDYVERFFETGIIGCLVILYMIFDFLKCAYKFRKNRYIMGLSAITIMYLVDAVGSFPFRLVPQGLVALWAWVMIVTYKEEKDFLDGNWDHRPIYSGRSCD